MTSNDYEFVAHGIPVDVAASEEDGFVMLAFIRADTSGEISVCWLPEIFIGPIPIPPEIKQEIVAKLRFHADKLESGETERRMQQFKDVNNPRNRA